MLLFDLGKLPGQQSILIFHALARMGVEALVIVSPTVPLASIGYFQDAAEELDIPFCRRSGIPFMRREVGGGTTYLDENQIFYQLIWRKDNPKFPKAIGQIAPWASEAPVETYRVFGIETAYQPVNDIVTKEGRKIAGQGGGHIGDCMVFVGGILQDFDCKTMSRILKVPDQEWQDRIFKTMEENLTTMKKELGTPPPRDEIVFVLREKFEERLGKLEQAPLHPKVVEKMGQIESWMTSEEFLYKKTPRIPTGVKIKEGLEITYDNQKRFEDRGWRLERREPMKRREEDQNEDLRL